MNDQERGQLLLDQERTEQHVQQLQHELKQHASNLTLLAQMLQSQPERVVFSNAPDNLGSHGSEYQNSRSIPWDNVDVARVIAQKIQDLRSAKKKLMSIQSQLASRF